MLPINTESEQSVGSCRRPFAATEEATSIARSSKLLEQAKPLRLPAWLAIRGCVVPTCSSRACSTSEWVQFYLVTGSGFAECCECGEVLRHTCLSSGPGLSGHPVLGRSCSNRVWGLGALFSFQTQACQNARPGFSRHV